MTAEAFMSGEFWLEHEGQDCHLDICCLVEIRMSNLTITLLTFANPYTNLGRVFSKGSFNFTWQWMHELLEYLEDVG